MPISRPATSRPDFFDPRSWVKDTHEHRIYLTADLELYAVVDAEDYYAVACYNWSSQGSQWKNGGKKNYARRTVAEEYEKEGEPYISPITGKLVRNRHRVQRTVFLHHVIAARAGLIKPSPKHVLDHRNGNELNCRRRNLRWVTGGFNRINIAGSHADVEDDAPSV